MENKFVFCIFGFVRSEPEHTFDFGAYTKYIYCPRIKFENEPEITNDNNFYNRYGPKTCNVRLYDNYDRSIFTKEVKNLNVPLLSSSGRIPHDGIFSFFDHVKKVLEYYLNSEPDSSMDDIIVLMRSDISVESIDLNSIKETLNEYDVKVQGMNRNVVADKYFCFKRKNISTFIDLYNSYKIYLSNFYHNNSVVGKKLKNTFPEHIFWYHVTQNNLTIMNKEEDLVFKFKHVCSKFCKHNYKEPKISNLNKKRIAILLKGAVSIKSGVIRGIVKDVNDYVNYSIVKNSINEYIIKPNSAEYDFDFYIHCWNTDLEKDLCELYNPVKYKFEKNEPVLKPHEHYGDHAMRQISQAYAIKSGINLIESSEINYEQIIIYRPDVLLWKEMNLKKYDPSKIYVNAHQQQPAGGDFHFVMNMQNANSFKNLVDSINDNPPQVHKWIKNYVLNFMKKDLLMDEIVPPTHQEVLRKICKDKKFIGTYLMNDHLIKMNIKIEDFI